MVVSVSLPMFEIRKVVPLILPYPPFMRMLCLFLSALMNAGTSMRLSLLSMQRRVWDCAEGGAMLFSPCLLAHAMSILLSLVWRA